MAVAKSPEVTKASFPGIVDVEKFETLTFESSGDQCSLFGVQHSNDPIFKIFWKMARVARFPKRDYYSLAEKKLQIITTKKSDPNTPHKIEFYCIFINKYFSVFQFSSKSFLENFKRESCYFGRSGI